MADRSESHALGNSVSEFKAHDDLSYASLSTESLIGDLAPADEAVVHHPGSWPLLHLTKKPTLTPVPRPHNAAALSRSAFADANLPVVNVHVKRKKLELRSQTRDAN